MSEMAFIILHGSGYEYWIRSDMIAGMSRWETISETEHDQGTNLVLTNGEAFTVDETPDEILEHIQQLYRKANQW